MANTQLVQARVDADIKASAAEVLAGMGLTLSDAVRVLLTRIANDRIIPAGLLRPNAETLEAISDIKAGRVEQFASVDAAMAALNADD